MFVLRGIRPSVRKELGVGSEKYLAATKKRTQPHHLTESRPVATFL
ncbi:hypothetical protein [Paenibacillus sp. GCM10027629]